MRIDFRDRPAIVVKVTHYLVSPICFYFRYNKVFNIYLSDLHNCTRCMHVFSSQWIYRMMSITAATRSVFGIDYEIVI